MKLAFGADHGGFPLKDYLRQALAGKSYQLLDMGTDSAESVDYPDFAHQVARAVASGEVDRGVLICRTGQGMCMAANKIPGVRAAHGYDPEATRLSRLHNDANVLCFGADFIKPEDALRSLEIWLDTEFEGGRHQRRVAKMEQ